MDSVRFGRGIRALRRRRRWRQTDLAGAASVSQSFVARVERGKADRMPMWKLERLAVTLGARFTVRLDYNGEALDRLLDADHAGLTERVMGMLRAAGWECSSEVTFAVYGERGSVDILARHPTTGAVLVIEIKTVVPDLQSTLSTLDRKVRLSADIASRLGWSARRAGRLLVIADTRTSRRRVAQFAETLGAVLPDRSTSIRSYLLAPNPDRPLRGLWFVPDIHAVTGRQRIQKPRLSG
ncbi:MAG: helix-turn-helix domain-containing protein [Chloroflexota bacterium]